MYIKQFLFSYLCRPIKNFNLILLENNKQMWSKFRFECWRIEENKSAFNFLSGCENNSISNIIDKYCLDLYSDSSIIVTSKNTNYITCIHSSNIYIFLCVGIIDNWYLKSLPYSVNGIVYINDENYDGKY